MKIVHATVEYAPFLKAGGLGDAVYSLSKQLSLSHDVEVVIPLYPIIFSPPRSTILEERSFTYEFLGTQRAKSKSYAYNGIKLTVIELLTQSELFNTHAIYSENDAHRFIAFSCAVANYIQGSEKIDIVHVHDWHMGLVPGILKNKSYQHNLKTVFTIHNFSYRGYCSTQLLSASSMDSRELQTYSLSRNNQTSVLMKGAILCAHYITTVSPTYAKEMLYDLSDYEIHEALVSRSLNFSGILNGIDETIWDPSTDTCLAANYDISILDNPSILSSMKEKNKQSLYQKLGIRTSTKPLLCMISRIVAQKGPEFMKEAILHAMKNDYGLILIGTCQEPELRKQFLELQKSLTDSPNIRIILDYNDALSRLTYGAADMICIPSHFEPCGLTQMIAMRYGTIPLVRKTGGLADTVIDYQQGFTFSDITNPNEFHDMLDRAMNTYWHHPEIWHQLITQGMLRQSGLEKMAQDYVNIYNSLSSSSDWGRLL
ncbi:glycogen/starch synthase, ADP-glucose type family protein [Chlamydia ibidis]|uniref:Glycogen synthase n=2 Tax=Chlamydia ibidis TaxID=1405396 RepID=S7J1Z6_9CHLA|nr:glycogen synthase GlgA [Chlamydia ibidis]EPP34444.1 glycogen/starch synthase, ADP-glucose type family protein [Chlamydia ibidis]EQM62351.1 glycogen/starch synthase, ADP-glucose type family protein [Chlamydia ibidis 10-1398/6]